MIPLHTFSGKGWFQFSKRLKYCGKNISTTGLNLNNNTTSQNTKIFKPLLYLLMAALLFRHPFCSIHSLVYYLIPLINIYTLLTFFKTNYAHVQHHC